MRPAAGAAMAIADSPLSRQSMLERPTRSRIFLGSRPGAASRGCWLGRTIPSLMSKAEAPVPLIPLHLPRFSPRNDMLHPLLRPCLVGRCRREPVSTPSLRRGLLAAPTANISIPRAIPSYSADHLGVSPILTSCCRREPLLCRTWAGVRKSRALAPAPALVPTLVLRVREAAPPFSESVPGRRKTKSISNT